LCPTCELRCLAARSFDSSQMEESSSSPSCCSSGKKTSIFSQMEDAICDSGRKRCTGDIDNELLQNLLPKPDKDDAEEVLFELAAEPGLRAEFVTPRPSFRANGTDSEGKRPSFDSSSGARRSVGRYTPQQLERASFKSVSGRRSSSDRASRAQDQGRDTNPDNDRHCFPDAWAPADDRDVAQVPFGNTVVAGAASLLKFLHGAEGSIRDAELLSEFTSDHTRQESGYKLATASRANHTQMNGGITLMNHRAVRPLTFTSAAAASSSTSSGDAANLPTNASFASRMASMTSDSIFSTSTGLESSVGRTNSEQQFPSLQTASNNGSRVCTLESVPLSENGALQDSFSSSLPMLSSDNLENSSDQQGNQRKPGDFDMLEAHVEHEQTLTEFPHSPITPSPPKEAKTSQPPRSRASTSSSIQK